MKFAVTAMGRSGTKFLASVLNAADGWTVRHEPHPGPQPVRDVRERFRAAPDNYGEVNSYLRWHVTALPVDAWAVILRDPMEIYQSMCNRNKPYLPHLDEALRMLDGLIYAHVPIIAFSRMTTDVGYLREAASRLGVVLPADCSLRPVNASRITVPMTERQREECLTATAWFRSIYEDEW